MVPAEAGLRHSRKKNSPGPLDQVLTAFTSPYASFLLKLDPYVEKWSPTFPYIFFQYFMGEKNLLRINYSIWSEVDTIQFFPSG